MATVKELYNFIKLQNKIEKPITPFHQSIVEAYEENEKKCIKERPPLTFLDKYLYNSYINSMSCSKCKKKQERDEILHEVLKVEKKIKIFGVVILVLTLYGLFSIISSLI